MVLFKMCVQADVCSVLVTLLKFCIFWSESYDLNSLWQMIRSIKHLCGKLTDCSILLQSMTRSIIRIYVQQSIVPSVFWRVKYHYMGTVVSIKTIKTDWKCHHTSINLPLLHGRNGFHCKHSSGNLPVFVLCVHYLILNSTAWCGLTIMCQSELLI